jgi:phage terminase small subunit
METKDLILIEHFCTNHDIEFSFIDSLQKFGLIEVIIVKDNKYLPQEQLKDVEKMMRMHYDLEINMEGIDVISNLLKHMDNLQQDLIAAQNKLRRFESLE